MLLKSEKTPVAVLKPPLVSLVRARSPVAVFWLPAVRWLSASKPVPVFHTPPVRLTSTPIPSPLLEPGMAPSVSGPTACAIGASPKQTSTSEMRKKPRRKDGRQMELFAERTITFILTNLSFSRRLTAWFGSEGGQKKLPGKSGLCLVQIDFLTPRRVWEEFANFVKRNSKHK